MSRFPTLAYWLPYRYFDRRGLVFGVHASEPLIGPNFPVASLVSLLGSKCQEVLSIRKVGSIGKFGNVLNSLRYLNWDVKICRGYLENVGEVEVLGKLAVLRKYGSDG